METFIYVYNVLKTLIEPIGVKLFIYGSVINGTMAIDRNSKKSSDLDLSYSRDGGEIKKGDSKKINKALKSNKNEKCKIIPLQKFRASFGYLIKL